jgi:hypothetical protein
MRDNRCQREQHVGDLTLLACMMKKRKKKKKKRRRRGKQLDIKHTKEGITFSNLFIFKAHASYASCDAIEGRGSLWRLSASVGN